MLSIILCFALVAPFIAASPYEGHESRDPAFTFGDGFLRAELTARENSSAFRPAKREVVSTLGRLPNTEYTIDLNIGTPPQKITVAIDTGSSDTWVNPKCAAAAQGARDRCSSMARFDYTKSSTLKNLGYTTLLSYVIGTALVTFVSDVVTIGSTPIKDQIFAIALDSRSLSTGLMGLAPPAFSNGQYPYVLDSLARQGFIASRAFSIDCKGPDDKSGAIIFGGVDTKKFTGALEKRPVLSRTETPDGRLGWWIHLTGIGITTPDGVVHTSPIAPAPVGLDTGTTLIVLPTAVFLALGRLFPGAQYDRATGFFVVDCGRDSSKGTVDFTFGKKVIRVPFADLIWNSGSQCLLVIQATNGATDLALLGTSFLRSAYVVYDEDNGNMHLAQAANCGTNILKIGTGVDAVPSSTGECAATSSTVPTSTADLAVSSTLSPTVLYSGAAVSAPTEKHGPQLSVSTVTGSGLPTTCTDCAATPTSSSGAEGFRVGASTFPFQTLVMFVAWGLNLFV